MSQTKAGKKKVYVEGYSYMKDGKKVTVKTHYRSTPN
jgi:hypothetical protein